LFFLTFSLLSASLDLKVPKRSSTAEVILQEYVYQGTLLAESLRSFHSVRRVVSRRKGGRGLISCEACVFGEENNLSLYVRNSEEVLLRKVGEKGTVKVNEARDPKEYQKSEKREMENNWKEKQMHGQYVRDMTGVDWRKHGSSCGRRGELKGCTEALICSAQEQAIRTNYIKFHIEKTSESPNVCVGCAERREKE